VKGMCTLGNEATFDLVVHSRQSPAFPALRQLLPWLIGYVATSIFNNARIVAATVAMDSLMSSL
jgi:hypothetical protein